MSCSKLDKDYCKSFEGRNFIIKTFEYTHTHDFTKLDKCGFVPTNISTSITKSKRSHVYRQTVVVFQKK